MDSRTLASLDRWLTTPPDEGPEDYSEQARKRVDDNEQLEDYRDLLLDYPWDNQLEHWEWIAYASIEEILDWCISTREES